MSIPVLSHFQAGIILSAHDAASHSAVVSLDLGLTQAEVELSADHVLFPHGQQLSWELLRDYAAAYVSCPDYLAATGMRVLATPLKGDEVVISGEAGAVTTGLLHLLMESKTGNAADLRKQLGLNKESIVLLVSTEGNTSPRAFRDAVWYGEYKDQEEERNKR